MKTLLKTLFLAIALTSATSVSAQTPTDSTFLADMPESMQSDMDSLYWDWLSKMHLTVDDNCLVTPTSPEGTPEEEQKGCASLYMYINTVQNTSVVMMLNTAEALMADVVPQDAIMAEAEQFVSLLTLEK